MIAQPRHSLLFEPRGTRVFPVILFRPNDFIIQIQQSYMSLRLKMLTLYVQTTTCWSTPEALTVTVTSEYEKDYTTTEYSTEYSTIEVPTTIEKDFTTTVYESFLSKITSVETVYTTLYSSYAESPVTITKVSISTVTVTTASVTIVPGVGTTSVLTITEACTPTSTLAGLVPCPSRIYNEQGYTPPAPLPSTYLWGCPP